MLSLLGLAVVGCLGSTLASEVKAHVPKVVEIDLGAKAKATVGEKPIVLDETTLDAIFDSQLEQLKKTTDRFDRMEKSFDTILDQMGDTVKEFSTTIKTMFPCFKANFGDECRTSDARVATGRCLRPRFFPQHCFHMKNDVMLKLVLKPEHCSQEDDYTAALTKLQVLFDGDAKFGKTRMPTRVLYADCNQRHALLQVSSKVLQPLTTAQLPTLGISFAALETTTAQQIEDVVWNSVAQWVTDNKTAKPPGFSHSSQLVPDVVAAFADSDTKSQIEALLSGSS